jgi:hypothetical protein
MQVGSLHEWPGQTENSWHDRCNLISAYSMDIGAARYVTTQGSAAIEIQVCVR